MKINWPWSRKNAPTEQRARSPTTPEAAATPAPGIGTMILSDSLPRQTAGNMPQGRLSRNMNEGSLGWFILEDSFKGKGRLEVITECRDALFDSDVGGAMRDLIALINPSYRIEYEGGTRAMAQAERATSDLLSRLHITLDELLNNQAAEVYLAGASSLEWYPTKTRSMVQGVSIVPAEEIQQKRIEDTPVWYQTLHGVQLDSRTFVYAPYGTRHRDPYGTPMMVAALTELERKCRLTTGTDKVINLMGEAAFLNMKVPKPTPRDLGVTSEQDPNYASRLAAYYKANVDLALSARDRGLMVTEVGVDSTAVPITQGAQGLADLELSNNLKLWSGLVSLPFMRGKMDSTTQALAQVVYPILLAHAENVQKVLQQSIEFGLNLNLQLLGIPARATLIFDKPQNPFMKDQAEAENLQAKTDELYIKLFGDAYRIRAAERLGISKEELQPTPPSPTEESVP
ncbi:hypothetical protein [Deinococcus cellulosilyticus]|uniref:Phage portal protein n=1 Tax=Deinococcus cellulosilyticus (strain DSM 18568 / NBRC 106333 / KACC 11606 / 5516J-15) TaxID=1223518 RepID=A0A511MZD8_DEIC1|nr:hypothetical protein [Deinococcus cellulosilyticus]GEM45902.1 hypothetical protein DC3_15370 [Deinococcus cellulosilyticus NBRC 106333 = KACC 11606]